MEKFTPKISPKERMIRKNFKNVGIVLGVLFLLLWFIQNEAKRVHTDMYGSIHKNEYAIERHEILLKEIINGQSN